MLARLVARRLAEHEHWRMMGARSCAVALSYFAARVRADWGMAFLPSGIYTSAPIRCLSALTPREATVSSVLC